MRVGGRRPRHNINHGSDYIAQTGAIKWQNTRNERMICNEERMLNVILQTAVCLTLRKLGSIGAMINIGGGQNSNCKWGAIFSERELKFMFAICHRPSVCLSVCRLSVTFVRPTQAIEIFRNVSMPFGTLAICWYSGKILRRSSQGNPSDRGVKHKRGSRI